MRLFVMLLTKGYLLTYLFTYVQCLDWNNGSQLAVCRQRWPTTVANTCSHNGCGSVNITQHCQWYPMGDVRTHNSRMDSRRVFKLGGGVDHATRHVWPLTKV